MKISKGSIFVIVFYTTIICVAVYTSCGTESENKKSKTEKLDSLRPYDRVFSTIKNPKCFHRDYNCSSIRHSEVIEGVSVMDAERQGLYPCSKCTEPYGIIHYMTKEDYKRLYDTDDDKSDDDNMD